MLPADAAARLPARAARRSSPSDGLALIAEIKKASPSQGLIRADFDPPALARAYAAGGAACLSVLTEESLVPGRRRASAARRAPRSTLPCLRKDFILEPYQVVEARAIGADCVLLIMAALDDAAARELVRPGATRWAWTSWSRSTTPPSWSARSRLDAALIGINNRNLKTLRVDLAHHGAARAAGARTIACWSPRAASHATPTSSGWRRSGPAAFWSARR